MLSSRLALIALLRIIVQQEKWVAHTLCIQIDCSFTLGIAARISATIWTDFGT